MISLVGAENVAPAEIGKWGTLAAEKVLAAKPDAFIIKRSGCALSHSCRATL